MKYILLFALLLASLQANAQANRISQFPASQVTGVLPVASGGTCGTGAVREATTNATLALTDCGNIIKLNKDDAITCTVPLNATVAFAIGSQINVIQSGAGAASIVAADGVTIRNASTLNFVGQWSRVVLTKIGTDEWVADGQAATGPAFSAYASAAQTLSNSTLTKVQFNQEEFDTGNCFDKTTNFRFTPNVAGYYLFDWAVNLKNNAAGTLYSSLYKNGSTFKRGVTFGTAAASGYGTSGTALVYMNGSTDYVEVYVAQSSGGNIDTLEGVDTIFFQGVLARAE